MYAQAPAASDSQEAAVVEHQLTQVRFENDGTSVKEVTTSVRIQSEAGVQQFGQLVEGYSSAIETLDVDYVRVRKPNGELIETPKQNEQDFAPEVLISAPMYSDFRERHITVVGLRPGDVLESHLITRTKTPLAAGQFWFEYTFPKWVAVNDARLEINVPKDRQITLKSPKRKYTTVDQGDRRIYTWAVANIRPDRKALTEMMQGTDDDMAEDRDTGPEIQLTTFRNWQQVGQWYAKLQGERVVVDNAIRAKAAEITKGATTPLEKTRRLYDYVARNFRYVSLSFGVGALQPHAAPDVLKGGYGDCKDKHTLLEALLRAEGITSYPALIDSTRRVDAEVPSPAQFDHEITVVKLGEGFTWLDTTAEVAPYGLLEYPLRNKEALLATDDASAGLVRTPASVPVKNTVTASLEGTVSETGTLDATLEIIANGDSALGLRAALRGVAQADWTRVAQAMSSRDAGAKVSDIDIGPLEDPAKPFHMRFRVHQENFFHVPSADLDFFPFASISLPLPSPRVEKARLNVGPAIEMTERVHLQFAPNFTFKLPPDMTLTRDYGEFHASDRLTGNVLDAERKLVLKVDELPISRRSDFESLRGVAFNSALQTINCTIRPASHAALAAVAPEGASADDLRRAAAKALQRRDFQTASELLKQALTKEPDNKNSWADLGRAYSELGDHADAVAAFQKQVKIDPYHKTAYRDLGRELEAAGQYDDAIGAYRKQLDNQPLDASAHKSLGLLLLRLNHTKEAEEQLQQAIAIPPADPEAVLALAHAYDQSGDVAKAQPLLTSVVGNASSNLQDLYAAALGQQDPAQDLENGHKLLDGIGDEFDGGAYADDPPDVFSAMHFVALGWARVGWALARKSDTLTGIRYLEAAWELSQSAIVANRLAQVNEQAGRLSEAKHWYALAAAAGDQASGEKLNKLDGAAAAKALQQAKADLLSSGTVKLARVSAKSGSAVFVLVFDGSEKPDRADFISGDAALKSAVDSLNNATYPVMFPDISSIKIVRRAKVSCSSTGCSVTLIPIEEVQPAVRDTPIQVPQKSLPVVSSK